MQKQLCVIQPSWKQDEITGLLPEWLCVETGSRERWSPADMPHLCDNSRHVNGVAGGGTATNAGHAVQQSRKWGYNWEIMFAYVTIFQQAEQLQGTALSNSCGYLYVRILACECDISWIKTEVILIIWELGWKRESKLWVITFANLEFILLTPNSETQLSSWRNICEPDFKHVVVWVNIFCFEFGNLPQKKPLFFSS